jgi:hypothetical protein
VIAAMHGGSSLYALDDEKLEALEPDLILTQELCRVCAVSYREVNEVVRAIDASITVISLEPTSIEGILNTITTVGAMAEVEDDALDLVEILRSRLGRSRRWWPHGATPGTSGRGSSGSSGWTRRSPSATGCPNRSDGRVAGTFLALTVTRPSLRPGTRSGTWIPRPWS